MAGVKRFKAALERLEDGLGWVVAWVPFEVAKAWPKMVRLRVVVEVGGEEFRTSLFAGRQGGHFVLVNKKMQKAVGAHAGDVVELAVWPDLEERSPEAGPELGRILKREKRLAKWYAGVSESTRRQLQKDIDAVDGDEAKMRRAELWAERLMMTMEAEEALPPLIRLALERRPGAMAGWRMMTEAQRRGSLMAVFYYRTAESRAKRLEKVVEECCRRVE